MLRKGKSAVKGDPKKSWSGIETETEVVEEEVSLVGIHSEEGDLTFVLHLHLHLLIGAHLHLHQSTANSMRRCGPRPHLGWVKIAVGFLEGPSCPRHSARTIAGFHLLPQYQ